MNSFVHAGRTLASELLPTLVFAILVACKVDVVTLTAVAIGIGLAQIAYTLWRGREVSRMQWASLGLVVTLGAAALLAHDVRILMIKPTVVYVIIGAVMLQRGWMLRYLPPIARGHGDAPQIAFGYVWAGLMFVTAAANLVIALAWPALWPAFLATFPLASKVVLFGVQFVTVRTLAIRSARAAGATDAQIRAAQAAA